jgi:5-methylcytosine-specific restriction endonuclease McrA
VTGSHALLLNADFTPYKVISWRRAVELIMDERADLVEQYVDKFVHSVTTAIPWPAVLRLREFMKPRARMRFNRQNVLARDNYTCAYCGVAPTKKDGRPKIEELTLDHVIPRAQSKGGKVKAHASVHADRRMISVTCWANVVTCCGGIGGCNERKGARTPEESGMRLRFSPRTPTMSDVLRMALRRVIIPREWADYLPEGAKSWSGYWDADLDAE